MSHQDGAIRDWDWETCAEIERLIQLGVPPWDATIQGRQRVSKTRRQDAAQQQVRDRIVGARRDE